jgi:hypothetical protein
MSPSRNLTTPTMPPSTGHTKYARYGRSYVEPMVSPNAAAATLRLIPR